MSLRTAGAAKAGLRAEAAAAVVDAREPITDEATLSVVRKEGAGAPVVASVEMLAPAHQRRALEARLAFAAAGTSTDAGERLLQELVAGEVGVALQLVDVEAGLASLLAKTIADPRLATEVAKVFRETVALSGAVRRRMEGCLSAAATLRAQRLLLTMQRTDGV